MGQVLHWGLLQGPEPVGGGRIMGAEAGVHNKLAEVWGFAESDQGRFDDEVLGGLIHILRTIRHTFFLKNCLQNSGVSYT